MKKVRDGAELLVLTDRTVYDGERRFLDPHLALSAIDQALEAVQGRPGEENLRRRCSIVLRSARDPQRPRRRAGARPRRQRRLPVRDARGDLRRRLRAATSRNICAALRKGIEKVISTIGIHEIRGYARQFSSIGVKPELAEIFQTRRSPARRRAASASPSSTPTPTTRLAILAGDEEAKPAKTFRFYPKVYKAAIAAANGTAHLRGVLARRSASSRRESPISMRHIMGLQVRPRAGRPPRRSTPASATTTTRS